MRIDRLGAAAADGVAAPPDGGSRPAPPQLQQHQNQRSGRHHHHLKDATLECSPQLQELLQVRGMCWQRRKEDVAFLLLPRFSASGRTTPHYNPAFQVPFF